MKLIRTIANALLYILAMSGSVSAQDSELGHWAFEVTPYAWAAGLDGSVGARDRSVGVNVGFSELIKHVDGALSFAAAVGRGRGVLNYEMMYINLSDDKATPGPLFSSATAGAKQLIMEATPGYRIAGADGPLKVDVFAGGRFWSLTNDLTFEPGLLSQVEFKDTHQWVDPIIGASAILNAGSWLFQTRFDVGGFHVSSKSTWQAFGALGYRVSDVVAIKAGYRVLSVDFDRKGFLYDVSEGGLITGVAIAF